MTTCNEDYHQRRFFTSTSILFVNELFYFHEFFTDQIFGKKNLIIKILKYWAKFYIIFYKPIYITSSCNKIVLGSINIYKNRNMELIIKCNLSRFPFIVLILNPPINFFTTKAWVFSIANEQKKFMWEHAIRFVKIRMSFMLAAVEKRIVLNLIETSKSSLSTDFLIDLMGLDGNLLIW